MRHIKALGYILAAEILSLFIGLTLASSAMPLIRFISALCTVGILICLMANFAINSATEDLRTERSGEGKISPLVPVTTGITATLPALASWIVLFVSRSSQGFDFYKWHKLLNAYFLQIFNFINSNAETSALSMGELFTMLPLAFIPCIAFTVTYFLVYKGVIKATN